MKTGALDSPTREKWGRVWAWALQAARGPPHARVDGAWPGRGWTEDGGVDRFRYPGKFKRQLARPSRAYPEEEAEQGRPRFSQVQGLAGAGSPRRGCRGPGSCAAAHCVLPHPHPGHPEPGWRWDLSRLQDPTATRGAGPRHLGGSQPPGMTAGTARKPVRGKDSPGRVQCVSQ